MIYWPLQGVSVCLTRSCRESMCPDFGLPVQWWVLLAVYANRQWRIFSYPSAR